MSDKYEYAARMLFTRKMTPFQIVAYLREQFPDHVPDVGKMVPEPVKIEGVRELVKAIRDRNGYEEFFTETDDEAERLITDFIEKREAGVLHSLFTWIDNNISPDEHFDARIEIFKELNARTKDALRRGLYAN